MIRTVTALICLLCAGTAIQAQDPIQEKYGNSITIEDIRKHMKVLTSEELEGREAGKKGGTLAASYINKVMDKMGLMAVVDTANAKSFYQEVPLRGAKTFNANVLGMVKGSTHPEEVLVITAHYDHLGVRGDKMYAGADDNASGVAALLEAAEAFALAVEQGSRPKRSVLFIALAAEEKGLIGSGYYTDVAPVFPMENTVVNLNMDMIGHLDDLHPKDPNFVSIVGSDWQSTELHNIHEKANENYTKLELDYTFNSKDHPERFFYRSDQYHFAKHGIPVIFYTSGDHKDYHKVSDVLDNIEYGRIEKVAKLVFHTAWGVANRDKRIIVDKSIKSN